jgi:ParB-like chromosome segregation protein Spo0J
MAGQVVIAATGADAAQARMIGQAGFIDGAGVVVRARGWFDDLISGRAVSMVAIAQREGISDRYVSTLMPLAFLAPDIVEAIAAGQQPADLTAETLIRHVDLPLDWNDQRVLLSVV